MTPLRGERGPRGRQGQRGPRGDSEAIHPWRWRLLTLWVVLFTAIVFYALNEIRDNAEIAEALAEQNQANAATNRRLIISLGEYDTRLQDSRVESCERNYRAMRDILLATTAGRQLDGEQQERLNRLLAIANPDKCREQVQVDGGTP
jgi:hypothetical protein